MTSTASNQLFLYGASGHGKVIAEIAEACGYSVLGFIDENKAIKSLIDYPVTREIPEEPKNFIVSIGNNLIRKQIVLRNNFLYAKLVHPSAIVSTRAEIGKGTVIMAGVTINSSAVIGKHCIVNTNTSVDHDCQLADYVHLSPNVALAGGVSVGEGTHIGIGACVIQGINIGRWATIGAGAVVIRDVPDYAVVVGNPGKVIKYNQILDE
jgi:acetyltransferase EpsM